MKAPRKAAASRRAGNAKPAARARAAPLRSAREPRRPRPPAPSSKPAAHRTRPAGTRAASGSASKRASSRPRSPGGTRSTAKATAEASRAAARKAPAKRPAREPAPRVSAPAEVALLRLAGRIGEVAGDASLAAVLRDVQAAFVDGALPAALFDAWLRSRGDTTAMLALAWAREQVRLGLRDVLLREARAGSARDDLPADTLAWLLLAGCEAAAHELPDAADDRLALLLDLVRLGPAGDGLSDPR